MENKQLTQQQKLFLLHTAQEARKRAYAPYSGFMVGAALMGESGKVYTGCNVENGSYPAGLCAERSAVAQGISQGEQRFAAIAITGGGKGQESPLGPAYPCGICRQVLLEFCSPGAFLVLTGDSSHWEEYTLAELLPHSFGPEALK